MEFLFTALVFIIWVYLIWLCARTDNPFYKIDYSQLDLFEHTDNDGYWRGEK